jgi:penicillin-binding protein 2
MYGRNGDWHGPPVPGQLALRVAILGGIALVMFVIIFLRLWYLEVLSGDQYLAQAQNNQVREFTVQAPRGEILDREGRSLVENRSALELQVNTEDLPASKERRALLIERLGELAGMSPAEIREEIRKQTRLLPSSPVTLQQDVQFETVYYLRENQRRFPGVSVERVYVRRYPQGSLAAHVLGYVREVSPEQLEDPRFESVEAGDFVGFEGVEDTYDSLLRGVNGANRVPVDASGTPTGRSLTEREPRTGNDLVLSIDADVQAAGEAAIGQFGLPAGFVAMKVNNGEILGLGSAPTYDPSVFAQPRIPTATARAIFGDPDDVESTLAAPAVNRTIAGAYPTGSTFKPITALAALDSGALELGETINDGGSIRYGGVTFENAGEVAHGTVDLRRALQVSSDVFFYEMGARTNEQEGDGGPIQDWSRRLGLGEPTGLDVAGEGSGNVPTPDSRNEAYERNTDPDSPAGETVDISEGEVTDRPWSIGDSINLSVGQGDLQANPLQMAVAYAAIANGGQIVRPHVGLRIEDPQGRAIQEIAPAPRGEVEIDPAWQRTIMEGLHDAAMAPGGTSYDLFGGYPVEIAGKTGTAERPPNPDQSWYVAVAPYDDPKYVVATTVERGGFGADAAAPATLQILNELLGVNEAKIEEVEGEAAVLE